MGEKRKPVRPIYRTSFCIEEALYESPEAKEPCFSRRAEGKFSLDLVRLATLGMLTVAMSAILAALLIHDQD